jgi:apolipoprotein N-acyltransferase
MKRNRKSRVISRNGSKANPSSSGNHSRSTSSLKSRLRNRFPPDFPTALAQAKAGWKKWKPDPLTLLSGILIVISFPPWNCWPLAWIFLIPWLAALERAPSRKDAILQGFWLSYFMSLGGFYWVGFVLQEFANLNWPLSILGLQIFCIFGQPQFFIFAPFFRKLNRSSIGVALFLAFVYTGFDWILPKLFMDTLGHVFYKARHIRQVADIGGASLLTFLIFFVNHALWNAYKDGRLAWRLTGRWWVFSRQLTAALALGALAFGYGWFRYNDIHAFIDQNPQGIQAAAIQANIGDFDKIASESGVSGAASKVLTTFTDLSNDALKMVPKPEVIIWPETSYPSTFRNPHSYIEVKLDDRVDELARSLQVPLLFGGYDQLRGKDYNTFFFLTPGGSLQIYHKSILLLFGEYIPGAESIRFIREAFPQVGNFGRGAGPDVMAVESNGKKVMMGPLICYEALFPNFVIESARKGAQIIMNITNDSWFGEWGEPQLHLALSTFRSIETRLPMIRSTNTGISALILADGEITNATEIGDQKIMNVFVPITPPIPTLMKLWGDWFGIFALGISLSGLTLIGIRAFLQRSAQRLKSNV